MSRASPRYFVARAGAGEETARDVGAPLAHAIDNFFAGARHVGHMEWVATVNTDGCLAAYPLVDRADFPAEIQAQLAYNEVACNGVTRLLELPEIYLFFVQLLEQLPEAPGANDPVYLYGTLYGPYPGAGESEPGVDGQLTVTRADVLEGLIQGEAYAFRFAPPAGGAPLRCFPMMLPADRDEELARGRGVVLAYPLLPPELVAADISNESIVSQILYDLLKALKGDLEREHISSPLRSITLPVTNRPYLEAQLKAQGYAIKGDVATRNAGAKGGFAGILASVFGNMMQSRLTLPPEAKIDEFLNIARTALASLPGWPPPRARALRNLVKADSSEARQNAMRQARTAPPSVKIPSGSPQASAPSGRAKAAKPLEWMEDFIAAHHKPGQAAPNLTSIGHDSHSPAPAKPARRQPAKTPDWMRDFEPGQASPKPGGTHKDRPAKAPDWQQDFE